MVKIDLNIERINMDWDKEDIADSAMQLAKNNYDKRMGQIYYGNSDQDFYLKSSEVELIQLTEIDLIVFINEIVSYVDWDEEGEIFKFKYIKNNGNKSIYSTKFNDKEFIVSFPS